MNSVKKYLAKTYYGFFLGYDRRLGAVSKGTEYRWPIKIDNFTGFRLGCKCYIGPHCHFDALGGISIEDYVIIGPHVKIWSYNHNFKSHMVPYGPEIIKKKVVVGKGAWLGLGVTILPGSIIGEGAIIGAGSIVCGTIPPYTIVRPSYATFEKLDIQKDLSSFYMDKKNTI